MNVLKMRLKRKFKLSDEQADELMKVGANTPGKVRELDKDVLELVVGKTRATNILRGKK